MTYTTEDNINEIIIMIYQCLFATDYCNKITNERKPPEWNIIFLAQKSAKKCFILTSTSWQYSNNKTRYVTYPWCMWQNGGRRRLISFTLRVNFPASCSNGQWWSWLQWRCILLIWNETNISHKTIVFEQISIK